MNEYRLIDGDIMILYALYKLRTFNKFRRFIICISLKCDRVESVFFFLLFCVYFREGEEEKGI